MSAFQPYFRHDCVILNCSCQFIGMRSLEKINRVVSNCAGTEPPACVPCSGSAVERRVPARRCLGRVFLEVQPLSCPPRPSQPFSSALLSWDELSGGSSPRAAGRFPGPACARGMAAVLTVLILNLEHHGNLFFYFSYSS